MAGNTMVLEFAGDADKLVKASKDAQKSLDLTGKAADDVAADYKKATASSDDYLTKTAKLGAAVDGASTAISDAAGTMQALVDVQQAGREKAARLARALNDAKQAQADLNQAQADGRQATIDAGQAQIDAEQAAIDVTTATKDYNAAVKEHGKNSVEAKQAQVDLKQAQQDGKQATEDLKQAQLDANQAVVDAESAQLDLADAQKEANPPDMQQWADQLNLIAPLLTGLVGIVGLVTAAQWAWNIAQLASPMTWIIIGIVALIAVIVLIATKTTWFQDAWRTSWKWIKESAGAVGSWFKDTLWNKWIKGAFNAIVDKGKDVWGWFKDLPGKLKGAFAKVTSFITLPFRTAFNAVSTAWNNTIGRLSWTVPGWIPGIGGNSFSAPQLPKFHQGGTVPGPPGREMLAVLQGGEKVSTAASGIGGGDIVIRSGGSAMDDLLVEILAGAIGRRGGNVQTVLGRG
jgi:hypothetical protein